MAITQEQKQSPKINKSPLNNHQNPSQNHNNNISIISPRFKSVAEMAGWDEEALLLASLVVEDTPERKFKEKRVSSSDDLNNSKSPLSLNTSRRKRRRSRVVSIPLFNLEDDDQPSNCGVHKEKEKGKIDLPKKVEEEIPKDKDKEIAKCSNSSTQLACMDRLKDELSCAICLDICYEPSTTPCGHSFCKNCLKNAADRCGKRCPKCRQLISNGRSCTINTVLWNTIQLLFPQEVEARKAAAAAVLSSRAVEERRKSLGSGVVSATRSSHHGNNNSSHLNVGRRTRVSRRLVEVTTGVSSRRGVPNQDEDAALALRLQREEFMEVYRGDSSLARDNLRAMARRAMNVPRNRAV